MITNESLQKLTQLKDIILSAQEAKAYVDDIISGINDAIAAKYSLPAGGIPKSDLDATVQAALAAANAAAPQSTTYTKTETDTLLQDKLEFETNSDPASLFE